MGRQFTATSFPLRGSRKTAEISDIKAEIWLPHNELTRCRANPMIVIEGGCKRGQGVHGTRHGCREHHVRLLRRRLRHSAASHNGSGKRSPSRRQVHWE